MNKISPANEVVGGYSPHQPPFGVRSCEVVIIHPERFGIQFGSSISDSQVAK